MTFYENHAKAHIGNLRLDEITRSTIKDFLQPLFFSNPDLAEKLTSYIRNVFEDAVDVRLIEDNPCPTRFTRPKRETKHAASLEYQRLPELWQWLDQQPLSNTIKVAMRLAIITAHRASVVVHMRKAPIKLLVSRMVFHPCYPYYNCHSVNKSYLTCMRPAKTDLLPLL